MKIQSEAPAEELSQTIDSDNVLHAESPTILNEPAQNEQVTPAKPPLASHMALPELEQASPIIVNGWTILPPKKKNKNLIRLDNVQIK